MKIHPADIAKEFKTYFFFRTFPEDLLLQISTLVEETEFSAGDFILREGEENKNLYFMRAGIAEVLLMGETVTVLQNPGEVLGEMSVITHKKVTTSIKAVTELKCFKINTDHFSYVSPQEKDHFLHLMYRMYSQILTDRLVKTNEKARMYELAHKELHQASVGLEKMQNKRVLLLEEDKKVLNIGKTALASAGLHVEATTEKSEAEALLNQQPNFDAILVSENHLELLQQHSETLRSSDVLVFTQSASAATTNLPAFGCANFLMSRDLEDRSSTIKSTLTTLTKVLSKDIFGIEKYLAWGIEVQQLPVKSSQDREQLREQVRAYFKKVGARSTLLDRVNTVTEELLMNAIYDAPVDPKGEFLYNNLSRKNAIMLDSHQQSKLRFATDGLNLAVSVVDPFGALKKETLLKYLESNYKGREIDEHKGKGGAGKGLHQIVENSDLTIFNVKKGKQTEVICLFSTEQKVHESQPSFHYFFMG